MVDFYELSMIYIILYICYKTLQGVGPTEVRLFSGIRIFTMMILFLVIYHSDLFNIFFNIFFFFLLYIVNTAEFNLDYLEKVDFASIHSKVVTIGELFRK